MSYGHTYIQILIHSYIMSRFFNLNTIIKSSGNEKIIYEHVCRTKLGNACMYGIPCSIIAAITKNANMNLKMYTRIPRLAIIVSVSLFFHLFRTPYKK